MNVYTLGIDSGSTTTKGVLFDGKKIRKTMIIKTSAKPKESIYKIYNELYSKDVKYTVTTGYGRNLLKEADKNVTEITCHAKGAAGTGRFVEVMMRILEEEIDSIDDFTKNRNPVNISSMCTVFAESEIISFLARDVNRGDIALGVIHSVCKRTASFAQKLNLHGDLFFSGGLALSKIFIETIEGYLNKKVITNELCQYAGAIGAATIGYRNIK